MEKGRGGTHQEVRGRDQHGANEFEKDEDAEENEEADPQLLGLDESSRSCNEETLRGGGDAGGEERRKRLERKTAQKAVDAAVHCGRPYEV